MFDSAVDAFGVRVENAINEYDKDTGNYPNDINDVLGDSWRPAEAVSSSLDRLAAISGGRAKVQNGKLKGIHS